MRQRLAVVDPGIETDRSSLAHLRELATQAFSRTAGAPLVARNRIRLLADAGENYPAWLDAIRAARRHVHVEMYFIEDDRVGSEFAQALAAKAREGVAVRLVYDWMGNFGRASWRFWEALRTAGVDVRCYNPPRLSSPLGWLFRNHRKMLAVDGDVAFITGLCIGAQWIGDAALGTDAWRDTGVEIRGPAVAQVERAFADTWAYLDAPDPGIEVTPLPAGEVSLRIVASEPATAGMLRLDQLVAALARSRLWITDAYYAGTPSYIQALRAAAHDGVDVRMLLPHSSDLPVVRALSRAGYRPLLEAGVRVFEWNGTMLHAKTAVADGHWARVGSTNLNVASWFGNRELDAVVEDDAFARQMEESYLHDLGNATEVVLDARRKPFVAREAHHPRGTGGTTGSATAAAAGAVRIGNAVGAALADRRALGPAEARLAFAAGALLLGFAVLFAVFPLALALPLIVLAGWGGLALLFRAWSLYRSRDRS